MDAFLPSEIGRLIYGYLFQQCGEGLADDFLNTCDSMRECRLLKQKYAKNFHHKVQDLSLEDILNQYSVLCSLIFKQASTEEPVHRNVLGLLRKVLSSRLLGLSSSSTGRNRAAKLTGGRAANLVGDKANVCKTSSSVVRSKQPENHADDKVDSLVSDEIGASKTGASVVAELEQQANPANEDNVAFSSGISDVGDNHMDVDDDDSRSAELEGYSSSNVASESAPVVSSSECAQKNISLNTESRICAILSNSASLLGQRKMSAEMGNLPFPAEYCTPRKQKVASVPIISTLPSPNSTKKTISDASTIINTSIENVSKGLPLVAENDFAAPNSGEHLSEKYRDEVIEKEKVFQRVTNGTPSKTIIESSSIALETTLTRDSISSTISSPAATENDHFVVTTPSSGARNVSPSTVSVNLSRVPMEAVSSMYQEPRVSAIPSSMTNITASASSIIPEETTESVFGELSFESECSLADKFDKSGSCGKSDSEVGNKLRRSPRKCSPQKADSVDSAVSTRSGVTVAPIQNLPNREAEDTSQTPTKSTADPVILLDSNETASVGSQNEEIPWDLKLRLFVDNSSSMDAHISKRKPKDSRSRKLKEVPKKRKHNDDPDEPLSITKRFKSDVVNPCLPSLVSKSVDIDKSVGLAPSVLRNRCGGSKEKVESTFELVEKKNDRNRRGKGSGDGKKTSKATNLVDVGQESKKKTEVAKAARSSTSSTDMVDLNSFEVEKKKSECLERGAAAEKKKKKKQQQQQQQQLGTNVRKASCKEIWKVAKVQSSIKPVALLDEKAINSTETAKNRKKSNRIEQVTAKKKSKDDADPKKLEGSSASFSQIIEKPSSSLRERSKSARKDAQSEAGDEVLGKADEILEDHLQSSPIMPVQETIIHNSVLHHEESDFEMVLEISPEFLLFHRSSRFEDS